MATGGGGTRVEGTISVGMYPISDHHHAFSCILAVSRFSVSLAKMVQLHPAALMKAAFRLDRAWEAGLVRNATTSHCTR